MATTEVESDRRRPLVAMILSALVGLVAAAGASAAIVSANAPSDGGAVKDGPAELLDPAVVLNYGG